MGLLDGLKAAAWRLVRQTSNMRARASPGERDPIFEMNLNEDLRVRAAIDVGEQEYRDGKISKAELDERVQAIERTRRRFV